MLTDHELRREARWLHRLLDKALNYTLRETGHIKVSDPRVTTHDDLERWLDQDWNECGNWLEGFLAAQRALDALDGDDQNLAI